jgi:MFS family permease
LGRLIGAVAAFEVGNVAATLLILRATELLAPARGKDNGTTIALILYTSYNIAAAFASVPAGRIADRVGAKGPVRVPATGIALFAAAYLGFAAAPTNVEILAMPFIAARLAIGCVETAQHPAIATLAPEHLRGSAFGLLATIQAAGNLIASTIAGIIWTAVSPTPAFSYLAAWMFVALAAMGFSARVRPGGTASQSTR